MTEIRHTQSHQLESIYMAGIWWRESLSAVCSWKWCGMWLVVAMRWWLV